jgi:hypothetical protein
MVMELAKRRLLGEFEERASVPSMALARRVADRSMTFEQAAEELVRSQRRR